MVLGNQVLYKNPPLFSYDHDTQKKTVSELFNLIISRISEDIKQANYLFECYISVDISLRERKLRSDMLKNE